MDNFYQLPEDSGYPKIYSDIDEQKFMFIAGGANAYFETIRLELWGIY